MASSILLLLLSYLLTIVSTSQLGPRSETVYDPITGLYYDENDPDFERFFADLFSESPLSPTSRTSTTTGTTTIRSSSSSSSSSSLSPISSNEGQTVFSPISADSVNHWNVSRASSPQVSPRSKPVYDPVTGLYYHESDPLFERFFTDDLFIEENSSPQNQTRTASPSTTTSEPIQGPISIASVPHWKKIPQVRNILVPSKCRGFDRMWDVYSGKPEEIFNAKPIGWISRIAYIDDLLKEFAHYLNRFGTYTMTPCKRYREPLSSDSLYGTIYLEIHVTDLFTGLFKVSNFIDNKFKRRIVAVVVTFEGNFYSVKIVFENTFEAPLAVKIHDELKAANRSCSFYKPYPYMI